MLNETQQLYFCTWDKSLTELCAIVKVTAQAEDKPKFPQERKSFSPRWRFLSHKSGGHVLWNNWMSTVHANSIVTLTGDISCVPRQGEAQDFRRVEYQTGCHAAPWPSNVGSARRLVTRRTVLKQKTFPTLFSFKVGLFYIFALSQKNTQKATSHFKLFSN